MAELERGLVRARGAGYEWQLGHPFTEVRCAAEGCGKRVGWLPEATARACPACGGAVARQVKRRMLSKAGFRNKREAQADLDRARAELGAGSHVLASRQNVGDYLEGWLSTQEGRLKPTTAASYRWLVQSYLVPHLGAAQVQDVTPSQLERLYVELVVAGGRDGKPLSLRTVRYAHSVLRKALADGVRKGLLSKNPAEHVELPMRAHQVDVLDSPDEAEEEVPFHVWDAAQVRTWAAAMEDDRLRALWLLLPLTGLRRGEALGLRWRDLDLRDGGQLRVRQNLVVVGGRVQMDTPKTRKSRREFSLDPEALAALKRHRKAQLQERVAWGGAYQDRDLVFCREDGTPLDPNAMTKAFGRLSKAAGLPTVRLHDLRHSYATIALSAGVSLFVVSRRLGHTTITQTADTYAHLLPSDDEGATQAVALAVWGA